MRRVLVLANNFSQASFRLRIAALAPLLEQRGFALDMRRRPQGLADLPGWLQLLNDAGKWDSVLLQRKFLDGFSARLLRRRARKIFYDIDDALMFHNRHVGAISRWRTARRFSATAAVLDHVVAGNEYLADIFRSRGCAVTVIPTVVDDRHYQVKQHGETPTPRLVWIGSKSTIGYLEAFLPAIESAAEQIPGLRLLTIADRSVKSTKVIVEHEPWSEQTESAALCRGDIGIAPTPSDQWTLGKCGFKILQYMSSGLPSIASPVGANAQIIEPERTGLLAATQEEWTSAIVRLAGDVALRARLGAAARDVAASRYSLQRAADDWAKVLEV